MRLFLLLHLFLSLHLCHAQNIDSLQTVLSNSKIDSVKCKTSLLLGIEKYKQGDFNEASKLLNSTIVLANQQGDNKSVLKAYNNLGNIEADKGNNTTSLEYYQKGLKVAEQINDKKYIAHINKNIGAIYVSMKRFDESLQYYFKAEKSAIAFGDSLLFADCNNNIGTVYEQQSKYDLAITYYTNALEIYKQYKALDGVAMAYSNLAIVYKLKNDFPNSIEYNLKSIEISKQLGDKWAEAATLNNIGNLYGQMGEYEKAKLYCNQSLKLSNEINALEIVYNIYESLAKAAYKAKDIESMENYYKLFFEAKDKFNSVEVNKQVSELNVKYETEKKQRENEQLQFEKNKTTKQRNWILITSILSIAIVVISFVFIQKNQKAKQKLQQQEAINDAAFDAEQIERERIARDLHDSVGQKLSVVKMQLSLKNSDQNTTSSLLDEAIQDVRNVSHNLLPADLSNGLIKAVEHVVEQINFTSPTIKATLLVSNELNKIVFTKQKDLVLFRIVQEILNNALKYSKAQNIDITLSNHNNKLNILINDNGVGFDTESAKNGIGIKNIKMRVLQLNGVLHLESSTTKGTNYSITIPY